MKKDKFLLYSNVSNKTPKNFKFIGENTYQCSVTVYNTEDYNKVLGTIVLNYKILNHEKHNFDHNYMKDYLYSLFNIHVKYDTYNFSRDRGIMCYIREIYLTKEQYKQYIRKIKLENILY